MVGDKMKYRLYKVLRPIVVFLLKVVYGLKIVNKENLPSGGFILVGNHKHNFDFISLISGTKRTVHFLGKKELIEKHGWLFKRLPVIPVDRSSKNKEAIDEAVKLVNDKEIVAIFPEGTFNKTEYVVMPFKYGAVKIASLTNAYIVPFSITGEYKVFKRNLKITYGKPYKIEDKRDLTKENIKLMNKVIRLMKGENNEKTK